jgi:long-chain fatty acid transport protein
MTVDSEEGVAMQFTRVWKSLASIGTLLLISQFSELAYGQTFGVELHNTLMPASGGMGGVSIARPQDLISSMNANPASMTQFKGTQFSFSGAWAEPTINLTQTGNIPFAGPPLIEPFSGKSTAPGSPVGNIGVTQELSELGLPAVVGVGFVTTSGVLADYSHIPASNGTATGLFIFSLPVSVGIDLTDRLSLGSSVALGIGINESPFVGANNMTADYALRGTLGANYRLNDYNTVGGYYQTKQNFTFDNAYVLTSPPFQTTRDVELDMPENLGLGFANTSLLEGRILLGADVLYKLWNEADSFDAMYDNQWVLQLGSQYTVGKYRFRTGYVWAENPLDPTPGSTIGGVIQPGELRAVRYAQGLLAVTCQHRLTGGVGIRDFLPGIDLDLMAGGMFRDQEQLGDFTSTSVESYWLGGGLTWRFGRGSCQPLDVPNQWSGLN